MTRRSGGSATAANRKRLFEEFVLPSHSKEKGLRKKKRKILGETTNHFNESNTTKSQKPAAKHEERNAQKDAASKNKVPREKKVEKHWWNQHSPSLWEIHSVDKLDAILGIQESLPKDLESCAEEVGHFFLYCHERQEMWERRNAGHDPPFSTNNALGKMSFCNNYRELDRGTCYFRSQILKLWEISQPISRQRIWIEKVLWASVCYRIVNKIETFEKLGGIPSRHQWRKFKKKLSKLPSPIFTSAHLIPGMTRYLEAMASLKETVPDMAHRLYQTSQERNLKGCFNIVREIPHVGDFFAWQVTCDLLESKCLAPCTDNDWTMLGPGARKGIDDIFGGRTSKSLSYLDLTRLLERVQDDVFDAMGLVFPKLDGKHLSLKVIEHALCEFSKFVKLQASLARNQKPGSYRLMKSRSNLDTAKKCECGNNSDDVFFCDFCLSAFCTDCASPGPCSWWKCEKCTEFESTEWAG